MNRPRNTILTEWETTLMNVIWQQDEITANDIQEVLESQGTPRSNSAIRTTLAAMERKGYLSHRMDGRTFYYSANIKQRSAENTALSYVRDVFFHGCTPSMILRLMEEDKITLAELETMRKHLNLEDI